MLPLDVPFVPDEDYPDFLADHCESLCSVHFSLTDPAMADARQRTTSTDLDTLIAGLNKLDGVRKHVLMNTRIHAPDKYFSTDAIDATASLLARLTDEAHIHGLIFSDAYYLQALSDAHPELATRLEAVPSVNTIIDSAERAFSLLDMIATTRFQPPTKLVLDRNLNRDFPRLEAVSDRLKSAIPGLHIHLIANEGCLLNCPYKAAHDAHIAVVNEGLCGDRTFAMNRDFGCIRRLLTAPEEFLRSPFIRPEDASEYDSVADAIKLCGRNKGIDFLKRTIAAYAEGQYAGNLLDLMDAMGDLSDQVDIPNRKLPEDFLHQVTGCTKTCQTCRWCASLAEEIVVRTDPGLHRL